MAPQDSKPVCFFGLHSAHTAAFSHHALPVALCVLSHRPEFYTSACPTRCYHASPFFQISPLFQPVGKSQRLTSKQQNSCCLNHFLVPGSSRTFHNCLHPTGRILFTELLCTWISILKTHRVLNYIQWH